MNLPLLAIYRLVALLTVTIVLAMSIGCKKTDRQAQGYVEGKFIYLAAPLSGTLDQLWVERGTPVEQGQLIFQLDPEPERSIVEKSEHQLLTAQAQYEQVQSTLWLAEATLKRNQDLYRKKAIQKAHLDKAQSQFEQTKAQASQMESTVHAAQATLEQATWALQQKSGYAPKAALVFDTYYRPGEFVAAGRPIVSLLAPQDVTIIFFIPESQLAQFQIGNTITLSCDGCSTTPPLVGIVRFISPENEYTPPVIFSQQTRQKLMYRVEAEPHSDNVQLLKPGQPVTIHW